MAGCCSPCAGWLVCSFRFKIGIEEFAVCPQRYPQCLFSKSPLASSLIKCFAFITLVEHCVPLFNPGHHHRRQTRLNALFHDEYAGINYGGK